MVDRRSLRKQNQLQNQSDPIPPEESRGSLGDRNPDTGDYATRLDNGGTYQAKKIFKASTGAGQQVQLNEGTGTADYLSVQSEAETLDGALIQGRAVGIGVPEPNIKEDEGDDNPDNPFFGNCGVCNNRGVTRLDCPSGEGRIAFGDGQTETFPTPAEIEFGGKVNFSYSGGSTGSLYVNSCADVTITSDEEDFTEPYDPTVYGNLLYQKRVTAINLGGTATAIKEFQVYQNVCVVTVVTVAPDGTRQAIAVTDCESLEGTYTPYEPTFCVNAGGQRACGVDPESLEYECVVRVYRLCQKYLIKWVNSSDGEPQLIESCDQLGYAITTEESGSGYAPGARPVGTGSLKYDSGIPRSFTVNAGGSLLYSGDEYGYFQIYQSIDNPCEYDIVGVKITGDKATFSGATTSKDYKTIYTGSCGFEITLNDFITEQLLTVYDFEGKPILETTDFVPSSVVGCEYDPDTEEFTGSCRNTDISSRVPVFEKAVSADTVGGVGVESIECIL